LPWYLKYKKGEDVFRHLRAALKEHIVRQAGALKSRDLTTRDHIL